MSRFSDTLMDYFQSPRNQGVLENADLIGVAGAPGSGRYVIIHLNLEEERVQHARFQSHGCGVTIACASAVTVLVQGRSREECLELAPEHIAAELDGLPADKGHCAEFAIAALRHAWRQPALRPVVEETT